MRGARQLECEPRPLSVSLIEPLRAEDAAGAFRGTQGAPQLPLRGGRSW